MKKILYIILFASICSLAISCTQEEVKPSSEFNGGGNGSDPK